MKSILVVLIFGFFCFSYAKAEEPLGCSEHLKKAERKHLEAKHQVDEKKRMLNTSLNDHDATALTNVYRTCRDLDFDFSEPEFRNLDNTEASLKAIKGAFPGNPEAASQCYAAMESQISGGKPDFEMLCVSDTKLQSFFGGHGGQNTNPGHKWQQCRKDMKKAIKAENEMFTASEELNQAKNDCKQEKKDIREEHRLDSEDASGQH